MNSCCVPKARVWRAENEQPRACSFSPHEDQSGRLNKTNTTLLAQLSCSQNIRQQTCAQFHWRGKHDSTLYSTVLGKPNKCTFYAAVDWSLIYLPGTFIFVTHDNDRVTRKHWLISLGFGCKWAVSITDKIKREVCFKFTLICGHSSYWIFHEGKSWCAQYMCFSFIFNQHDDYSWIQFTAKAEDLLLGLGYVSRLGLQSFSTSSVSCLSLPAVCVSGCDSSWARFLSQAAPDLRSHLSPISSAIV